MTRHRAPAAARAFDALAFGRLTWMGLIVAAIGWMLLIGEIVVGDVATRGLRAPGLHADLVEAAKCLIGSGLALAAIGALQTGFGTLNRFFEAVLSRSAGRSTPPRPVEGSRRERPPHRTLPDGSVEVETIFGTRRFATMREAAEFI